MNKKVLEIKEILSFHPKAGWTNEDWAEYLIGCLEKIENRNDKRTFLSLALYWAAVKARRPGDRIPFGDRLPRWITRRFAVA